MEQCHNPVTACIFSFHFVMSEDSYKEVVVGLVGAHSLSSGSLEDGEEGVYSTVDAAGSHCFPIALQELQ